MHIYLFDLIEYAGGKFESKIISYADGGYSDFDEYRQSFDEDKHRNGNYLTLLGEWN